MNARDREAPGDDTSSGAARVVSASPVRCPYCHDSFRVRGEEWVACSESLARHHESCWAEGGSCAGCGGAGRLIPTVRVRARAIPRERRVAVALLAQA